MEIFSLHRTNIIVEIYHHQKLKLNYNLVHLNSSLKFFYL